MRKTRDAVRVFAIGCLLAGGTPAALGAENAPAVSGAAVAASAMASANCPAYASCGSGCTAQLGAQVCSIAVAWETGLSLGSVQVGPRFRVECYVCDCMYLVPGSAGTMLRRNVDASCGATVTGLNLQ